MKNLTITLCTVLLALHAVSGYSQSRRLAKPTLFDTFPTSVNCTAAQLSSLFTEKKGANINLVLADNLTLSGIVSSNLLKYSNLQTIIIKLPAFKNTLCSLSKQTDKNNNNIYTGRILNPLYTDGFELKPNKGGNYQFTKIDTERIFANCNQ